MHSYLANWKILSGFSFCLSNCHKCQMLPWVVLIHQSWNTVHVKHITHLSISWPWFWPSDFTRLLTWLPVFKCAWFLFTFVKWLLGSLLTWHWFWLELTQLLYPHCPIITNVCKAQVPLHGLCTNLRMTIHIYVAYVNNTAERVGVYFMSICSSLRNHAMTKSSFLSIQIRTPVLKSPACSCCLCAGFLITN